MSRKFSITVPDLVGRVVDAIAEYEGEKPTSVAAFILQTAVKERLASGQYPAEYAHPKKGPSAEAGLLALEVLRSLITGDEPDPKAVEAAATALGIAPHELEEKLKKEGNGHGAKSAR